MRLFVYLLFFLTALSVRPGQTSNHKIKIVFRFDDYMMTQHIVFDSIFQIFKENNIPLTIGLVPYDKKGIIFNELTDIQLKDLRDRVQKQEIEVALHGFNHNDNKVITGSLLKKALPSEFYGLNYNEQLAKIVKGKEAVDSILNINTTIFIPPYNSYDDNTIKALENLKFEVISASMNGLSVSGNLSYIPFTISDLTKLPQLLSSKPNNDYSVIVVIHPYSFIGGIKTALAEPIYFSKLDTLLKWINGQEQIVPVSFSKLARSEKFDNKRFVLNSNDNNILMKIFKKSGRLMYGVFNSSAYQRDHRIIFGFFNVLFHVIVFLTFYFSAKFLRRFIKPNRLIRIIFVLLFLLLILAVLYKAVNSHSLVIYVVFLTTIVVACSAGIYSNKVRESH